MLLDRTHPLSRGLVGYWPINEGAGAGIMDLVSSNNGLGSNTSLWTGANVPSRAMKFVGTTTDFISVPYKSSMDLLNSATVCAWINTTSGATICPLARDVATGRSWAFQFGANVMQTLVFNTGGGGSTLLAGAIPVNNGKWNHCAFTYQFVTNGTSILTNYVNGQFDSVSVIAVGPINIVNSGLFFGKREFVGAEEAYVGSVAGVRIYNRALPQNEIMQLANLPFAGLKYSATPLQLKKGHTALAMPENGGQIARFTYRQR